MNTEVHSYDLWSFDRGGVCVNSTHVLQNLEELDVESGDKVLELRIFVETKLTFASLDSIRHLCKDSYEGVGELYVFLDPKPSPFRCNSQNKAYYSPWPHSASFSRSPKQ